MSVFIKTDHNTQSTNVPSQTEFQIAQSERAKRSYQKRKEGTESITALDERSDPDKFEEAREFFNEDE